MLRSLVVVAVSISLVASPGCGPGGFGQGGGGRGGAGSGPGGGGDYQTELMELDRLEKDLAAKTAEKEKWERMAREDRAMAAKLESIGEQTATYEIQQTEKTAKEVEQERKAIKKQVEAQRERVEKMRANRR